MARKQKKDPTDARIERLYGERCHGVQVSIMDIPNIFQAARNVLAAKPDADDKELGDNIASYVESIRKN